MPRKSRNYERDEKARSAADGHYFVKPLRSERERTDRSSDPRTPSRKISEHDSWHSIEKVETIRSTVRRGNADSYKQESADGRNNSPLQEETDFSTGTVARKALAVDKKRPGRGDGARDSCGQGSPASERDPQLVGDLSSFKSSVTGQNGKGPLTISPKKSDRDAAGELLAKGSSPRKHFGRDWDGSSTPKTSSKESSDIEKAAPKLLPRRDEDEVGLPRTSLKSKSRLEGPPEEANLTTLNRNSASKSPENGQSAAVDERISPGAHSYHEEGSKKTRPNPTTFLHIAKKARSDRDRGRREEPVKSHSSKSVPPEKKEDTEVTVKLVNDTAMDEADQAAHACVENPEVAMAQSEERQSGKGDNVRVLDLSISSRENFEMEEGELDPEDPILAGDEQKVLKITDLEEDGGCEKMGLEAPFAVGGKTSEDRQEFRKVGDQEAPRKMVDMNEEEQGEKEHNSDNLLHCMTTEASASKERVEVVEISKKGLTLDLLHENASAEEMHVTQPDRVASEKGHDPSRELTLSLSSKSAGAEPKGSRKNLYATERPSDLFEAGEQLHEMELRMSEKSLAGRTEELGEPSGHGNKQKKMKIESLQLSLALPGASMAPPPGSNASRPARPVESERTFQSLTHSRSQTQTLSQAPTWTNSDEFTASLSLSHSFVHNPSCSLNLDNQEFSCGASRQISQGNEQMSHRSRHTPSGNEQMSNGVMSVSQDRLKQRHGVSLYQQILQTGNMQGNQGFPSVSGSNRSSDSNHISRRSQQVVQRLHAAPEVPDGYSQDLKRLESQNSLHNDSAERLHQQEVWLASNQPAGSRKAQSEPYVQLEKERLGDYPAPAAKRFRSVRIEDMVGGSNLSYEKIGLHEIATEPVAVMAQKLQELPDSFLKSLKSLAKEMLGSIEKREEFITLQDIIRRRTDVTEEVLLHAHRTQLEILVALKTGMQAFVQEGTKPQIYKALIEIFQQTRCRNIDCQQSLPVDGCECRVCSQKSGFCHECMCVVCSKFDSDNNTCRWVGCDVCLHWCHSDCGLRMSYIVPAPNAAGTSDIQFRCVACGHHSELFGFVKEVFQKCAGGWDAEVLAKELDCVRRIFHGSEDTRGRQLCQKAEQMLRKLENKVDVTEVCRSMLRFFNETTEGNATEVNPELSGPCTGTGKQPQLLKPNEASDHKADTAIKAESKMTPVASGSILSDLDKALAAIQTCDKELEEKRTRTAELQYDRRLKQSEIQDLERVIRIKQAESKMFQARADEARQEASGLKRIASVKHDKMEEDFATKCAKLRLDEAEEARRKRFDELHALERAHHDYQRMKIRMQAEIKDLLLKMQMTKQPCT